MRSINKIIIHCSATREGQHIDVDTIRRWHVDERGWSDVGYHFIIYLDGQVVNGRPIERSGAHTKGHNRNSIGICYIGGVDNDLKPKDTRTEAQKLSFIKLITDLKCQYPDSVIHSHNDFANKACPSFDATTEYRSF
jgi:N-acetylmuramoyl-L-alanine amidase|tara:strand:+ start:1276 stop:1686 length:411 start_codon:yes stop_codon:yes gene_type:complete